MKSSATSNFLLVGLVAGIAALSACGSDDSNSGTANILPTTTGTAGSNSGASGSTGTSGTSGSSGTSGDTTGSGGSTGGSDSTGGAGDSTTVGSGGSTGSGGMTGMPEGGSAGGGGAKSDGGSSSSPDITKVAPTAGCGKPASGTGRQTLLTMGTKPQGCADQKCGNWTFTREYFLTLPAGYDPNKAYPLVLEGPGCGSGGQSVYGLNQAASSIIRVGLTPPQPQSNPDLLGHATNPGQGCFDDKEGDDSVDWTFYENLYDKLAGTICFDKNRVFSTGNSSGAWFSNEVGCKYAGDATRPIRGIMPNTGGLPTDAKYVPTCTTKPMAGIWMGETQDPENPFAGNVVAINRAIKVNNCTGGDWGTTPTTTWAVGGDMTCKNITGCPMLYPLIVCLITGNQHAGHDNLANPAFSQFLQKFSSTGFLTQ